MISKLFKLLSTFGLTALGRVLGYGRDIVLAALFGTSLISELFVYAFRFQLFWRTLFVDQSIPAFLVPRLSQAPTFDEALQSSLTTARRLALGFALISVLIQPLAVLVMARGFWIGPAETSGAVPPWMLASLVGIGASLCFVGTVTSTVFIAGLQAKSRFRSAALVPLIFNIILMLVVGAAATVWVGTGAILAVALTLSGGFLLAGLSQTWLAKWLFGPMAAKVEATTQKSKSFPSLTSEGSKQFAGIATLRLFEPLPLLLVSGLASVHAGYLTGFYFAERLTMLIPSILGLVVGAVLLTDLAKAAKAGRRDQANRQYLLAAGATFAVAAVGAVCFALLSDLVIDVAFGRGAFEEESALLVQAFLAPLVWLIPFAALEYVVIQPFIIAKRTRLPIVLGATATAVSFGWAMFADSSPQAYAWALCAPAICRISILFGAGWFTLRANVQPATTAP